MVDSGEYLLDPFSCYRTLRQYRNRYFDSRIATLICYIENKMRKVWRVTANI